MSTVYRGTVIEFRVYSLTVYSRLSTVYRGTVIQFRVYSLTVVQSTV